MIAIDSILNKYLQHRLDNFGVNLFERLPESILLNKISASIIPSGNKALWNRRPSISDDGEPVVLSLKIDNKVDTAIRILVESGSLRMSVPQQVAYSLTKLDDLLGELGWRDVIQIINSITTKIFPINFSDTIAWRGGMWLGAEVVPNSGKSELRIYFNLRHGNAAERWNKLSDIITSFSSSSVNPYLDEWISASSSMAIPVGVAIVISANKVVGVRAYLGVQQPTLDVILKLIGTITKDNERILTKVVDSFIDTFGNMQQQSVTMGYDFFPNCKDVARVKVDICCHLIDSKFSYKLIIWLKEILKYLSYKEKYLSNFLSDVNSFWGGSVVQFLSLGFTPEFQHATIYVKTGT